MQLADVRAEHEKKALSWYQVARREFKRAQGDGRCGATLDLLIAAKTAITVASTHEYAMGGTRVPPKSTRRGKLHRAIVRLDKAISKAIRGYRYGPCIPTRGQP